MPWIVTTKRERRSPLQDGPPDGDGYCRGFAVTAEILSRRAVATLDEAHEACNAVPGDERSYGELDDFYEAVESLPESGGTVGPLPDGTVIEVELAKPDIWHDDEGVWAEVNGRLLGPFDNENEAERAFCAAYNEAQGDGS